MQVSTNINELLEEWETVKDCAVPIPCTLEEALEFTNLKIMLTDISHQIRTCRLENNPADELEHIQEFFEVYSKFSKDHIYRILKGD